MTINPVKITSVEQAKAMIGNSDQLFPGAKISRFGMISGDDPGTLAATAASEYVYGNSATVQQWTEVINKYIFTDPTPFTLFTVGTVTINAGATLVVGINSDFFICKRLRIHSTATLTITGAGPVHEELLAIEPFC